MDWLPTLERVQSWHWWVLGALLLILEVAAPGIFFVWLALAAFALGLLVFVLPILPVAVQLLLFAALSVAAVTLGRRYVTRLLPDSPEAGRVNRGAHRLVGQTVTVVTPIVNGIGRVRVGDSEWRATGPDTPQGARVVIVAADGPTLHVREVNGTWT
ncbi:MULTISPECIES: NfeD family protein [Deinococcus]|uniref:Membrane protein n=1 Tax=Deinococcus daejeonensis TaxID=1007098 RepID=A0ABQ2J372_9DEIO|nr:MULTISPECIES: NfeD family protein [Deinococcus]NTY00066.1 NfeD family protein [Deinococcus sp. JMULE3]RIY09607.1 NfeD family protein [Deinococcus sp. RM]GGN36125.1 membrane protein [Deinococcus daejeonensis]